MPIYANAYLRICPGIYVHTRANTRPYARVYDTIMAVTEQQNISLGEVTHYNTRYSLVVLM